MMSSSQYLNIKSRHWGFDVRAGGDEKQNFNFACPYTEFVQWIIQEVSLASYTAVHLVVGILFVHSSLDSYHC